jgi:hypothetical protein
MEKSSNPLGEVTGPSINSGRGKAPTELDKLEREIKEQAPETQAAPAPDTSAGAESTPAPTRRKRRKVQALKSTTEEVKPLVLSLSFILESAGLKPLREDQIKAGCAAWLPVYDKYLKGGQLIWVAPIVWTTSVFVERREDIKEKVKDARARRSASRQTED